MRNGFRAYDSDTHVNPAAEVLDRYVDPGFRARLPELEPYRFPSGQAVEGESPDAPIPRRDQILPPRLGREGAGRHLYRARDALARHQNAAARHSGRPAGQPRRRYER